LPTSKKICQVKKSSSPTIWHNFTKVCLLRCKITHTDYSHHWYIRTRLQCGHIFMTRYAKSHTHMDLARRSSILLHVVIEQAPLLLTA
jgi:hypothetical protein